MAIKSGFFDSINKDRMYTSNDINLAFKGIVSDGVFPNVGAKFAFSAGTGLRVSVGTGKAWIAGYWVENTSSIVKLIDSPDTSIRNDVIYLEVDNTDGARESYLKINKGTPGEPPTLMYNSETNVYRLNLGYVIVRPGATSFSSSDFVSYVGTSICPFCNYLATEGEVSEAMQNQIELVEDILDQVSDLMEDYMYKPATGQDHLDITPFSSDKASYITSGFITDSRANLFFDVRLPSSLKNVTGIRVGTLSSQAGPGQLVASLRTVDGQYIGGTYELDIHNSAESYANTVVEIVDDYTIRIKRVITNSSIFTNVPANNTPVSVEIHQLKLVLSFD